EPQIWWISVLLPAPFGPISAWISPCRRSRLTPSVALSAPKFFRRLESWRTGSAMARLSGQKPEKSPAREQHHAKQDQTEEELPSLGDAAQRIFEQHIDHGPG